MLDHIGLDVADIARSKAFYAAALKPLGYRLLQEIREAGTTVAMFGDGDEPDFVIADKDRPGEANHVAFSSPTRTQVDAPSTRLRSPPAAATTVRPACVRTTARPITPPSSWTPTASTSRRSATRRSRPRQLVT